MGVEKENRVIRNWRQGRQCRSTSERGAYKGYKEWDFREYRPSPVYPLCWWRKNTVEGTDLSRDVLGMKEIEADLKEEGKGIALRQEKGNSLGFPGQRGR